MKKIKHTIKDNWEEHKGKCHEYKETCRNIEENEGNQKDSKGHMKKTRNIESKRTKNRKLKGYRRNIQ